MDAFVRFQTALRCGNTGRPLGLFHAAGRVEDDPHVANCTKELLSDQLEWFNTNLVVPSLDDRGWRCLFWFRSEAQELIERMWNLVALLKEEGVLVKKIWSDSPGEFVYWDRYQIGAIPFRNSNALHRK